MASSECVHRRADLYAICIHRRERSFQLCHKLGMHTNPIGLVILAHGDVLGNVLFTHMCQQLSELPEGLCHYNSTAATFDHFSEIASPTSPDIKCRPSFTCPSRKHYVNSRIMYPCPTSPSFNSLYQSPLFPALLYPQSSFPTFFLLSQPSIGGITTSPLHLTQGYTPYEKCFDYVCSVQVALRKTFTVCMVTPPPFHFPLSPCWAHDCGLRDYASRRLVKGLPGSFCAVTDGQEPPFT